ARNGVLHQHDARDWPTAGGQDRGEAARTGRRSAPGCGTCPARERNQQAEADPSPGGRSPQSMRISVVFPAPLAPIRPKIFPDVTVNDTLSTARKEPYRRVSPQISIMLLRLPHPLDEHVLKLGLRRFPPVSPILARCPFSGSNTSSPSARMIQWTPRGKASTTPGTVRRRLSSPAGLPAFPGSGTPDGGSAGSSS